MQLQLFKSWLSQMDNQLSIAKRVFGGGEVSAVMLDPVGFRFPRQWYAHMLRYQAGVGLVPSERNKAYMCGCDCAQCLAVAS